MSSSATSPGPPQKSPELVVEPMPRPLADGKPVFGMCVSKTALRSEHAHDFWTRRGRPIKLLLNTFWVRLEIDGGKPMQENDKKVFTQSKVSESSFCPGAGS